jgi:hypothetical protein
MKKIGIVVLLMGVMCNAYAQEDTNKQNDTWRFIKLSYAKGFKSYGLQNIELKDQNFTSVIAAEVNVYKQHGFYAEFINQPLMALTAENNPLEIDLFFYSVYYDAYIRSRGFNVGYAYTESITPRVDIGLRAGVGQTYAEFREYVTNDKTLQVSQYNTRDTMTNWSIGLMANYSLPNNLGVFGEAALCQNTPVFKLGLTYNIKTK